MRGQLRRRARPALVHRRVRERLGALTPAHGGTRVRGRNEPSPRPPPDGRGSSGSSQGIPPPIGRGQGEGWSNPPLLLGAVAIEAVSRVEAPPAIAPDVEQRVAVP